MDVVDVVLSGQEVKTVDSQGLYVLSVSHKDFLDRLQGLLPVSVDHVDLGLFQKGWEKVLILNRNFSESLQGLVVLLLLLMHFCLTKH